MNSHIKGKILHEIIYQSMFSEVKMIFTKKQNKFEFLVTNVLSLTYQKGALITGAGSPVNL